MAITASDLEYRFSAPEASGGNQQAQDTPANSLGLWLATTPWLGGALHDLFGLVSGDDNANMSIEYRCLFFINKHATLTLTSPVAWFTSQVSGGAVAAMGVDPTAASALNTTTPQALEIANRTIAPAGVAFSAPTSKGAGIALGNIGPRQCKAVWIRRSAFATVALDADGFGIRVEGDSLA